jgi:hypothetical protein
MSNIRKHSKPSYCNETGSVGNDPNMEFIIQFIALYSFEVSTTASSSFPRAVRELPKLKYASA